MNTAYLIIGGNKGDKLQNLKQAITLLEEKVGHITQLSDIYITAAWGNENQPDFYNQAICIESKLSAQAILQTNLSIEEGLGRIRTEKKWMERTMDIDILFYNDEVIDTDTLTIPHPHLQDRKFVLIPLNQIAPNFVHPITKKSINKLLTDCKDALEVSKYG